MGRVARWQRWWTHFFTGGGAGEAPPAPRIRLRRHRIRAQLRRHLVAIISLMVALSSLGYNTWRNESSELQRNYRQASFELVREVNELQQVVLYRRYFVVQAPDMEGLVDPETWIIGWGRVASIRDLTAVLPDPLPERGGTLHAAWNEHAAALHGDSRVAVQAEQALLAELDLTRAAVLDLIRELR